MSSKDLNVCIFVDNPVFLNTYSCQKCGRCFDTHQELIILSGKLPLCLDCQRKVIK